MKILILFTYNKGLLSEFFKEVSFKLSNEGYDVVNYSFKQKKQFFTDNNVKVYTDKRKGYVSNYWNIYKIINFFKPDLIISNFSYVNPALLFGYLLGVKHNIVWFHTVYGHGKPNKFKVFVKSFFLKLADLIVANSKLLQDEMHEIYKVPVYKTKSIPFWTNIKDHRLSSKTLFIDRNSRLCIGCPGRLLEDKNHQTVINAVQRLKSENNADVHLYIAGDGSYKTELETLVSSLNISNNVTFLGLLSVEEMVTFYDSMDVVVLPSFHEAFGLVFIESISLGKPVIVSSQFGALNFIDSKRYPMNDFTFNPNSVNMLYEKLLLYTLNKGISGEFFQELYEKTFEKHLIYDQIKKVIEERVDSN